MKLVTVVEVKQDEVSVWPQGYSDIVQAQLAVQDYCTQLVAERILAHDYLHLVKADNGLTLRHAMVEFIITEHKQPVGCT